MRTTKKLFMIYYLITLHIFVVYLLIDKTAQHYTVERRETSEGNPTPVSQVSPDKVLIPTFTPDLNQHSPNQIEPTVPSSPSGIIIPVQGVTPDKLTDSFTDARSEGRIHDAIDIPAPAGTPVLAAADGNIVKFWESKAGGITIYELSRDKRFVYYYAHLQSRAADIYEGDSVAQGRVIGFVGDTGNAGTGNYHLHFGISELSDPKRYWDGTPVNPFPLLRR